MNAASLKTYEQKELANWQSYQKKSTYNKCTTTNLQDLILTTLN